MEELIYAIDKEASDKDRCLVFRILVAKRQGFTFELITQQPLLTKNRLEALASPKDGSLLPVLIEEESQYLFRTAKQRVDKALTPLNLVHLPPRSVNQAFKLLATTGKLTFEGKPLVVDLHSQATFHYKAAAQDGTTRVTGVISSGTETFDAASCSFVGQGSPHFFIKGVSVKFLSNDVPWNDFKTASTGACRPLLDLMEEADQDPEAPRVVMEGPLPAVSPSMEPLPILTLKDRTGAFADLSMAYGEVIFPLNVSPETAAPYARNIKRHPTAESGWEKDLLETDFIKKHVSGSHYYCPMDKVAKSLAFLLEIGWEVRDWKGNKVLLQSDAAMEAVAEGNAVKIKGNVRYGEFEADLKDVIGAFNRRERFAQIAPGHVALIPPSWKNEGMNILAEEAVIIGEELQLKRSQIGAIGALFDATPKMSLSKELDTLKQSLASFQGINEISPGNGFKGTLRPYQQAGLNWLSFLQNYGFNGMLADDMGLGKTVQVIAFLSTKELHAPALIVVPTSLIFNWKKELEKFLPSCPVLIHHGTKRSTLKQALDIPQVIITTYATLRLDLQLFRQLNFQHLILDEAQTVKNSSTQSFQAVSTLNASFRLSITGTPVENHLMELWSHFRFLMPDLLGDEEAFSAEIQAAASDTRFLRRIQRQVRPFLLRRTKEEVARDLPEKIEQTVWIEMGEKQRELYDSFLSGIRHRLVEKVHHEGISKHRMEVLEAIMRLKQICCHPLLVDGEQGEESSKLDTLIEDLETVVEEGKKVLVYSQFTTMLKLIGKKIKEKGWKAAYLDGSTKDREKVVESFQNDKTLPIFLISLKAGGVGLNLTAADYVLLYDPWWNNAAENQAIDRAHRIGRKETVIAKRYIVAESIEEKIMKLKEAKSTLASVLLDDAAISTALTADDLMFLIQ